MNINAVANTIRGLSMDAIQKANSGHPGAPLGLADFASVLFLKHLKYNPADPDWADRDRFVLSAGHASMLVYSLLHLAGYDLELDELKQFRQWGSRTPGHPEFGLTPGVETTTGPLGQGCGNGVGMALAEALLAARSNNDTTLVDHHTYVIASDGDLMEGISHEAFSLAGHLGLGKLVVFYDSNRITIEGSTDLTYSEDTRKRFEGYNWHVLEIDGHNHDQIDQALTAARAETKRPTIIIGHTHIGQGSPNKHDTAGCHGAPLGDEEIRLAKEAIGLPPDQDFHVPDEVYAAFRQRREELAPAYQAWQETFKAFRSNQPEAAQAWDQALSGELPADLESRLTNFEAGSSMASRKASGTVIQDLAAAIPSFIGGSADLGPSNNTTIKDGASIGNGDFTGRNLHFGIREHAMGSLMNGMMLHKGFHVFGGTFLIFSEYFRPAIRLAALMKLPCIYVFSHDSIFVGEDGPTHQPIEQLASLRAIPGLTVIRPADANETARAWLAALRHTDGPTALVLTRQSLPTLDRTEYTSAAELDQGAYILWQSNPNADPDLILLASGSEVSPALEAARELASGEHNVRVVSMPSWELFEQQSKEWQDQVLPPACTNRLAVEAGVSLGWDRYITPNGQILCIDHYGASAPNAVLAEQFGFTAASVIEQARKML